MKPPRTNSFEVRTELVETAVRALCRWSDKGPGNTLVFVSGKLADQAQELAYGLAMQSKVQWLIVGAAGVLSEKGEVEGDSAAVALSSALPFGFGVTRHADPHFAASLHGEFSRNPGVSIFAAVGGDSSDESWIEMLQSLHPNQELQLFGGGTRPGQTLFLVAEQRVHLGGAAYCVIPSAGMGRFGSSSACRLISPLRPVSRALGPVLVEIEGMLALERLSEATADLRDQPLVMLALGAGDEPLAASGRSIALRAIQGVDPTRGALVLNEAIAEGTKVAFAIRDSHAARKDFKARLNQLRTNCAGAAPDFGIYISCAGRGAGLYGQPDVDTRLIKQNFPDMPFVGMHSTFELAPMHGKTLSQIYTGVLGIFSRLS